MNMRISRVIIYIALLVGSLWLSALQPEAAMLTFTFDDGSRSTYATAYPIMKKYNKTGVVYVISRRVADYYDNYIHADQLREMQDDGWEIGSHSVSHRRTTQLPRTYDDEILNGWEKVSGYQNTYRVQYDYDDMALVYVDGEHFWGYKTSVNDVDSAAQGYYFDNNNNYIYIHLRDNANPENHEIRAGSAQREIQQSYSDLTALGFDISSFVPPYGSWDDSLMGFAAPIYHSIVGCSPCDQDYNPLPLQGTTLPMHLTRTHSAKKDMTLEDLSRIIDEAIAEDAWTILSFHGIYDDDNFTDPYGWPKDKFEQLVKYVSDSGVSVVTVSEGFALQCAPVPAGQHIWNYEPVEHPVKQCGPANLKPFAIGNLSSGNLNLQIGLPAFSEGVDIYLAFQTDAIEPGKVFVIDNNNNSQPLETGLLPWKIDVSSDIDESLFGNIPVAALPSGLYSFYTVVTPTGETDFSHYYFWSTSFTIQ
ncbi:MAG: polysaccharide deacetylase family protein [Deltaproteobacteria bacterium]|nr:polysaccharide deacetylase family protein [Deltaproteobacteria bacterium]